MMSETILLPTHEDGETPIIAPVIVGEPNELKAPFSISGDNSMIDFRAGDDEDGRVRHIAFPHSVAEVARILRDARILKRRIYFMVGPMVPGVVHTMSGEPVLFGRLCVMRKF